MSTMKKSARSVVVGDRVMEPTTEVKMSVTDVRPSPDAKHKLRITYVNISTDLIGWWDFEAGKMLVVLE